MGHFEIYMHPVHTLYLYPYPYVFDEMSRFGVETSHRHHCTKPPFTSQPDVQIRHSALRHAFPRFGLLVVLWIDADIPQWELAVLSLEVNPKACRVIHKLGSSHSFGSIAILNPVHYPH